MTMGQAVDEARRGKVGQRVIRWRHQYQRVVAKGPRL